MVVDVVADTKAQVRTRAPATVRSRGTSQRLVIVSNRVAPSDRATSNSGGLAVAIRAALRESGGIWFGWSGDVASSADGKPKIVDDGQVTFATLDLSPRDYEEYYIGYANSVLWPLLHSRGSLVEFSRRHLAGYLRVNRMFADALAPMLATQDLVWVHDYHLIPLAEELHRRGCAQPTGFFLHTPFPAAELLRVLPNQQDLVRMLCAYDLIGFQTKTDLHCFGDYLVRYAGGEDLGDGAFRAFGRTVRAQVFPIGIDVGAVSAQAQAAEGTRHVRRLRESLGEQAMMIGVDRLDYTKGLMARFHAFEHLLATYPETRGRVVFMQIAPPSRSEVPEYREIRRSLAHLAGHINGRFGEFDWSPLRYINKSFPHRVLTGFYRLGQIGLVTPLRDGMNLVAKEYVASQRAEDPGVLVLSCFAGAADELTDAVIVNPCDIEGMAEAILQGLDMPLGERRERWGAMMAVLRRNDVTAWRESFVHALRAVAAEAGHA